MESSPAATQKLYPKSVNALPPTRHVWIFYHYLHPDTVVSAALMHQLCSGLAERGWRVIGFPGNRGFRDESPTYPPQSVADGVQLHRIWRPRFHQSSTLGRLLNAAWMIVAWSLLSLRQDPPDAIVIGTDPVLSITTAISWKFFAPETHILHWCFDLYPEAAYADGLLSPGGRVAQLLRILLKRAYAACDAIVDIGSCMREQLLPYAASTPPQAAPHQTTIVPWALQEPPDVLPSALEERRAIAGERRLVLLYSGSFGRAHTSSRLLILAQALRHADAALVFSVQGNCEPELRAAIAALTPGTACDVLQVPFAPVAHMLDRLAAPDIHLLSLADHWTGLVVPSKCFGALAVGRPLLFSGSRDSSIARWIDQYQLGWVLDSDDPGNIATVAGELLAYVQDPARTHAMQQRCFDTYRHHFSQASGVRHMDALLRELSAPAPQTTVPPAPSGTLQT